mmetsp:Transcript_24295/g.48327  ORF Transcript_24295/g.48327 Transcript_24295/m.48327 type:complete len:653 (+) Transcript_24295:1057-3015(+)
MIRCNARNEHAGQGLGTLRLNERVPVPRHGCEYRGGLLEIGHESGTTVRGNFADGSDGRLLCVNEGRPHVHDKTAKVVAFFVVRVAEIEGLLFGLFLFCLGQLVPCPDDFEEVRHQLCNARREFIAHDLAEVGERGIGKLVQVRVIRGESLAGARHGPRKVGPERVPFDGDRDVSHALQGASAETHELFVLALHQFFEHGHHARHVGRKLRLRRHRGGGERRDGHLLHAPSGRGLKHGDELRHEALEEGAHPQGFELFAEHLQHVAARGLHRGVRVVEESEGDGQDAVGVLQDLRAAVLRELSEREAGALPDLRIGVGGRGEDVSHNLSEVLPDGLRASLRDDAEGGDARLPRLRLLRGDTRDDPFHGRLENELHGHVAGDHVERALRHGGGGGSLVLFVFFVVFAPGGVGVEERPRGAIGALLDESHEHIENARDDARASELLWLSLGVGGDHEPRGIPRRHLEGVVGDAGDAEGHHRGHVRGHGRGVAPHQIVEHVAQDHDLVVVPPGHTGGAGVQHHRNEIREGIDGVAPVLLRLVAEVRHELAEALQRRALHAGGRGVRERGPVHGGQVGKLRPEVVAHGLRELAQDGIGQLAGVRRGAGGGGVDEPEEFRPAGGGIAVDVHQRGDGGGDGACGEADGSLGLGRQHRY